MLNKFDKINPALPLQILYIEQVQINTPAYLYLYYIFIVDNNIKYLYYIVINKK